MLAPSQPGCPSCGILGESPPPLSLTPLPREVLQHPSSAVRAGVQIRVGSKRPCPSHHTHTLAHIRGQQRQDKGRNSPPGPHTSNRHPPDPQPGCQSQTHVPSLIHRGSTQALRPAALCQGLHTCFYVSLTTPRQSRDQNAHFTWEETGAPKSLGKRHPDLSPGTCGPALHLHGPHPGLLRDKNSWTPKGLLASETTLFQGLITGQQGCVSVSKN